MHLLFQTPNPPAVWYQDPITVSTIIIAVATVINVVGTLLLWLTTKRSTNLTRDMFEAAHRPYVTFLAVKRVINAAVPRVEFRIQYQNVGSVPAYDFKTEFHIVTDGTLLPNVVKEEEIVTVVFPAVMGFTVQFTVGQQEYDSVINATNLGLILECTYKGVAEKEYRTRTKLQYDNKTQHFNIVKQTAT
jgi:hypothetical protein